jgi:hypothetical protein
MISGNFGRDSGNVGHDSGNDGLEQHPASYFYKGVGGILYV